MRTMFGVVAVVGLGALLGGFGCSSTQPAGTGRPEMKTHRVTGEVSTLVNSGLDRAFEQSVATVRDDMRFTVEKNQQDSLVGVVTARTAQNKLVTVTLHKKSDTITSVNVSAGAFDSDIAKAVAEKIAGRLQ